MYLIEASGLSNLKSFEVQSFKDYLSKPASQALVTLDTDIDLSLVEEHLDKLSHVLIEIDSFTDGRGFSIAHQLRHRYRFTKPIWAKGSLLADQFPQALHCGFDAVLVDNKHLQRQPFEHWMGALTASPTPYRYTEGRERIADNIEQSNFSVNHKTIEHLNAEYTDRSSQILMNDIFLNNKFGDSALVSSFGTESAVLLHMLSKANVNAKVLFIDTGKLFEETLNYQKIVTQRLNLKDVEILRPDEKELQQLDGTETLHLSDVDACCELRKIRPLRKALNKYESWVSGRKSFQGDDRQNLRIFEQAGTQLKINPLANWSLDKVNYYMKEHNLPEHPLKSVGFDSVGCEPCTSTASEEEPSRSGRWRDTNKTECGIHYIKGTSVKRRQNESTENKLNTNYSAVGDSWAY